MDSYEEFQSTLQAWLVAHSFPESLHRRLYDKIAHGVFDSGNSFALARWPRSDAASDEENSEEDGAGGGGAAGGGAAVPSSALSYPGYYLVASRDLSPADDVWLVDHCCTFQLPTLRDELLRNETLRTRLETISRQEPEALAPDTAEGDVAGRVEKLLGGLWPYMGGYDLMNPRSDDAQPHYWYVADEIGSALNTTFDGDEVNVRMVTLPFYFASQQCVFSFFWATAFVEAGTALSRRPQHRFEQYAGEAVSRVLYESWSGEPPKAEVIASCREAWHSHYREQAHVSAQRNVQNQLTRAATIALERQEQRRIAEPVYPPLLPMPVEGGGVAERLPVYVSHRGVAAALSVSAAFQGPAAVFQLVSLPSEAAVVWMANHVFRSMADFGHARFVVYLPEHVQVTNARNLAALEQHAVGKTPLVAERLDGVSQLAALVGSAVEEGGTERGSADCVWELVNEDGRRVWGPVSLSSWSRVREVLRVAEMGPLCLVRVLDGEALSLAPGLRTLLHVPVLIRSWQSAQTGLEAYLHRSCWASFLPATGPVTTAAEANCECVGGAAVQGQLAALTGRVDVWQSEVMPVLAHTLRDVLAAVVPMDGVDHARLGAVLDVQVQLVVSGDGAASVMPVLVGLSEHLPYNVVLQHCPSFFADALSTLCLSTEANVLRL